VHVAITRRHYKGKVYETTLLRRSYREGGKVKHETLGNLSHLPAQVIELVRRGLAGETFVAAGEALEIERSLPHGQVAAVLGTLRRLGLERLIGRERSRERDLIVALVCQRLLKPGSKLSATRQFGLSTLGEELSVEGACEAELLAAMDWLLPRQQRLEAALARRELEPGGFVLHDLSSSWLEGTKCPLAAFGYSRDRKRGKLQITYGLTCSPRGRPIAIEVFGGEIHDDQTLPEAAERLKARFGIERVCFVGDRGMVKQAGIEALKAHGFDWITALTAPQVKRLAREGDLQLSLFDETSLGEIESADFPGERIVVCRNPHVAHERRQRRQELLEATERQLAEAKRSVDSPRGRLHRAPAGQIGERVGRVVNRYKVAKHFELRIADGRLDYALKTEQIAAEAALDGFYVLRTSLGEGVSAQAIVRAYKQLAAVERAFRAMKASDLLALRPIHHRLEDRVRAHALLCMLAYAVRLEMEERLAELLFVDEAPLAPADPTAEAQRSQQAKHKTVRKRTQAGLPVSSFRDLLDALATLTRNRIRLAGHDLGFDQLAEQTPLQRRALELLQVDPNRP
jgi:Transposase DDE domain